MYKKLLFISIFFLSTLTQATAAPLTKQINKGLDFLSSVQFEFGEFPSTFYPNIPEPQKTLQASYDSNLFTTAMIADALHTLPQPLAKEISHKAALYIKGQEQQDHGLWSYFTTHTINPIYPRSFIDLDDTAFASMVLKQQGIAFNNNTDIISRSKDKNGLYVTFIGQPFGEDLDCGVNVNVLSYLQENDENVCRYLNDAVASGQSCALFYNQLDSYYLISRAYHSGISCLSPSVNHITDWVLSQLASENGSFNNNAHQSAMALNILKDFSYQGEAIEKLQNYLLSQQKSNGGWEGSDFWLWSGTDDDGNLHNFGFSRSAALTTAISLKALGRN